MKKLFLFVLVGLSILSSQAQNCGTATNFTNTLPTYNYIPGESYDEAPVCVRVYFHIVRNSAGTNGYNASNIQSRVDYLNQVFNQHNIVIVNQGQDFINNDDYGTEFNDGEYNSLVATNNVASAINIYLLPVDVSGSVAYAGKANGIPGNALVVAFNYITTSSLPHELGHCLNLFHTHHQLESGSCDETSGGQSCSSCGDYVCDTPIDPLLSCGDNVDPFTCAYIGSGSFTPLTNNLMSYSCKACRDRFTSGQGLRMRISLRYDELLGNFRTIDCINITGNNQICSSEAYTINNVPANSTVSWSISNANATISASGNNCNVTKVATGFATLICTITTPNGNLIASKDLIIGTGISDPLFEQKSVLCPSGNNQYMIAARVTETPGATSYKWYIDGVLKTTTTSNSASVPGGNADGNTHTLQARIITPCGQISTALPEGRFTARCGSSGGGNLRIISTPNPTTGLLNIAISDIPTPANKELNIKVYDVIGNLKFEKTVPSSKFLQIDLRHLQKGNYFLFINNKENSFSQKITIN